MFPHLLCQHEVIRNYPGKAAVGSYHHAGCFAAQVSFPHLHKLFSFPPYRAGKHFPEHPGHHKAVMLAVFLAILFLLLQACVIFLVVG